MLVRSDTVVKSLSVPSVPRNHTPLYSHPLCKIVLHSAYTYHLTEADSGSDSGHCQQTLGAALWLSVRRQPGSSRNVFNVLTVFQVHQVKLKESQVTWTILGPLNLMGTLVFASGNTAQAMLKESYRALEGT